MSDQEPFVFRVVDLKQYVYCARIFYYQTVLPQIRPLTYKMSAGIQAHLQAEVREKRRQLRSYGLQAGTRTFNVPLLSEEVGLSGEVDMLIETETELIPVDYKLSKKEGKHFRLQVAAYGRLLAAIHPSKKRVRRGFLYLIPNRKAMEVSFTPTLDRQLTRTLNQMRHIAYNQMIPPATPHCAKCVDCEFRRFCNDL